MLKLNGLESKETQKNGTYYNLGNSVSPSLMDYLEEVLPSNKFKFKENKLWCHEEYIYTVLVMQSKIETAKLHSLLLSNKGIPEDIAKFKDEANSLVKVLGKRNNYLLKKNNNLSNKINEISLKNTDLLNENNNLSVELSKKEISIKQLRASVDDFTYKSMAQDEAYKLLEKDFELIKIKLDKINLIKLKYTETIEAQGQKIRFLENVTKIADKRASILESKLGQHESDEEVESGVNIATDKDHSEDDTVCVKDKFNILKDVKHTDLWPILFEPKSSLKHRYSTLKFCCDFYISGENGVTLSFRYNRQGNMISINRFKNSFMTAIMSHFNREQLSDKEYNKILDKLNKLNDNFAKLKSINIVKHKVSKGIMLKDEKSCEKYIQAFSNAILKWFPTYVTFERVPTSK